tara:strand:- start:2238 stop:4310 length:2073 start_codon:yes stop_codon:yes gene_type:complete
VRFGKYFLLDKVAVGGMAEIFRAKSFGHSGFEKVVVIKRILSQFASNEDFVEMFIDEAKLSVELTHPNIVQIYDFGKIDKSFFIAMESVQGKDLRSILKRQAERGEYIPFEVAAFIAHEMACGLDFAHKKTDPIGLPLNIVHRDISPSNVLISYGGHVKVVDFGIAKAESASDATESGVLKGKFQYMSPEQAMAAPIDHRSDIYSLGICLWEMLTGNRLFKRATGLQSLEAVRAGEVPLPSSYNPTVPQALEDICMQALRTDAKERYQEACQMQADLQHYLLPHTISSLAPHVSTWLRGRFGEEILRERERLDRGTALVAAYKGDDLTFGGENAKKSKTRKRRGNSQITRGGRKKKKQKSNSALVVLGTIIVLLLVVLLIGLLIAPMLKSDAPTSNLGSIVVDVLPAEAKDVEILLDGAPIQARHDRVKPGVAHRLEVRAAGYETRIKSGLELEAGQVYRIEIKLEESQLGSLDVGEHGEGARKPKTVEARGPPTTRDAPAQARTAMDQRSAPQAASATGQERAAPSGLAFLDPNVRRSGDRSAAPSLAFISQPSGAGVYIEGRKQGTTPFSWTGGSPGKLYQVEFRKPGYRSVKASINAPGRGEESTVERALKAKASGDNGTLSVSMSAGYARVFIDGEFVGTTPLQSFSLAPGEHLIRVANPLEELDLSTTIKLRAGEHLEKVFDLPK